MAGVGAMKSKFEANLGKIHYRINYEEDKNLTITVVECKDLKKMDLMGKSDPFVKVFLMPGNHKELKTKVIKKNLNPLFNEVFKFVIPVAEVSKKTVVFQVFDWDKISKTDGIGEVQVPLWQLNLSKPTDEWKNLHTLTGTKDKPVLMQSARSSTAGMSKSTSNLSQHYSHSSMSDISQPVTSPPRRTRSSSSSDDERKSGGAPPGVPSLKYHLQYEHDKNVLVLTVVECKNLKKADLLGGKPDAFVNIHILPGSHKEIKTKVVKNSIEPVFDETFRFELPLAEIHKKTILLQVSDWDRFSKNDKIGEVQIPLGQVDFSKVNKEWRSIQPTTTKPAKSPKQSSTKKSSKSSSSDDEKKSTKRSSSSSAMKGPPSLRYKIHYEHPSRTMVLTVMEAKNLLKADLLGGSPDAYVQVALNQSHKELKTKTVKSSPNPVWNEDFRFEIPIADISQKTLSLKVYDWDRFSKNDPIGEVQIPLWQVDFSQVNEGWKNIEKMSAKPNQSKKPNSQPRRGSTSSFSSDDEMKRSPNNIGRIKYTLSYETTSHTCILTIHQAKNLKKADLTGKPDPYVSVNLTTGGLKETKTKTVKNNPDPVWNETFRFSIPDLVSKTLLLQIFDWDMLSKNDPIGEIQIPLSHFDFSRKITEWKHLQKYSGKVAPAKRTSMETQSKQSSMQRRSRSRSSSSDDEKKKSKAPAGPPSINYQIVYQQSSLIVTVLACKNLKKADLAGGAPDGYVDVYLLPGENKPSNTKTVKSSLNPVFNESFKFPMPHGEVAHKTLIFQVFDWDRFSKNDPIGELKIQLGSVDISRPIQEWKVLQAISGKPTSVKQSNQFSPARSPPSSVPKQRSRSSSSEDERKTQKQTSEPSLSYKMHYEQASQSMVLNIVKCSNLKKADLMGGKPDPIVNIFLLPGNQKNVKTKVIKNEQNPMFNETFRFQMSLAELAQKTLIMEVADWDRFSKNDPMGEVKIPLNQIDFSNATMQTSLLQKITGRPSMGNYHNSSTASSKPKKSSESSSSSDEEKTKKPAAAPGGPPKIRYQVLYDRNYQSLRVTIIQCQDLKKGDLLGGKGDPFVQVFLLPGSYKLEKTKTVKNNSSPLYNETFVYQIPVTEIPRKTIVLQVWDYDKLSKNDPVGEVQIPLWEMDLYKVNDEWKDLHPVTGTVGKPVLRQQPAHHAGSTQRPKSFSGSSSSSDEEEKQVPVVASIRNSVQSASRRSSSSSSSSASSDTSVVPHNLSLKELNDLLLKYIDQVRYLEQRQNVQGNFSVNVDRHEVDALHHKYESQLSEWKSKYEKAEHDLAESRINVDNLQGLNRELAFLRGELEKANQAQNQEKKRSSELEIKLRSMEQELKNRIAMLEAELVNEKGRSNIDMSSVDTKLKGEYEARLKKELKALRKMYEDHMRVSNEEFMFNHNQKLLELENALAHERNHNSSSGAEAKELRIRVEDLRRKMAELEASNQSLGHKSSELQINLQEQASTYQSQLAGKDREIEYLKKDIIEVRRKYEEIYGTKLEDLAEVKVYSGLIMPEIQRLTKQQDRKKHRSKSRTRKSSSSSDEDERKTQKTTSDPSLTYKMHYEQASQSMVLNIIKCSNLKKADLMGGKPDPIVNIFGLPSSQKNIQTKVIKNEQNPTFNETFRFQMSLAELYTRTLIMEVADWDRFSKNDPMGEVKIPLNQIDFSNTTLQTSPLQKITKRVKSDEEKRMNGNLVNSGESLI